MPILTDPVRCLAPGGLASLRCTKARRARGRCSSVCLFIADRRAHTRVLAHTGGYTSSLSYKDTHAREAAHTHTHSSPVIHSHQDHWGASNLHLNLGGGNFFFNPFRPAVEKTSILLLFLLHSPKAFTKHGLTLPQQNTLNSVSNITFLFFFYYGYPT